jgi:hypothetical protein
MSLGGYDIQLTWDVRAAESLSMKMMINTYRHSIIEESLVNEDDDKYVSS